MSEAREQDLSDLLVKAGVGWLVADPRNAPGLLQRLDEAAAEYNSRFKARADLLAACKTMPEKMRAFLQALMAGVSSRLLAMVARILLREASVVELRFEVVSHHSAALHIEIQDPDMGRQSFDSTDIWDAEVLRHFGLMKLGDEPIIAGYFAAKMP